MDLQQPIRSHHVASFRSIYLISTIIFLSCPMVSAFEILGNETDRLALLELKAMVDDPLRALSSWNTSIHFCRWYGVTCGRKHQRVTALELGSNTLTGNITPHVGNMSVLKILDLRNNSFRSGIPPEVGRLFRLRTLLLSNNFLGGQIPQSLSNCSNLVTIGLRYNMLEGDLPPNLGSLRMLKRLLLEFNNLTGEIPLLFGNLSSVKDFMVTRNNLNGVIPESFGSLRNLENLALGGNNLVGSVPSSVFNISPIIGLDVSENHLVGSLPWNLGLTLPNLQFLGVSANHFTGVIPSSISNASNLSYLGISGNSFTGGVPSLQKMHKLWMFNIGYNDLGNGHVDDLNFLCSLTNSSALKIVSIQTNRFRGTIPACIGNLSMTIGQISLSNNSISGMLPSSIGNLINLDLLKIWGNGISGIIPSKIGNLGKLNELDLSENEFSGQIPESLGKLKFLTWLVLNDNNLQGTIPLSLSNCQNLLALDLSSNELNGTIPPEILGLSSLSIYADFSGNFLTGNLPMEVGNLKNLGLLYLHGNRFSGEIPSTLGNCIMLERLYMQDNLLEGDIPSNMKSLEGIRVLNLSNNRLSGQIPEFLEELPLSELFLAYNEFEGPLPFTKGVFRNASAISIAGNKKLCGGLPEFQLPDCNTNKPEKRRRKYFVRHIIIYSIPGFLGVAFLSVLAFLFWCKRKRKEPISSESEDEFLKVSYQSLLKATNGFSSDNLIGVGSFGSVFRGVLDVDETRVAIKVLNLERYGATRSFIAECEAFRNMRHRNLVKVLTACSGIDYQGNDFKALVYEFMANGSLEEWVHPVIVNNGVSEKGPRRLGLHQRLNIAIDVACALDYLHHQCGDPMVHCDLKPSNVLLDDEMTGHVGDFGLVRFVSKATHKLIIDGTSSTGVKGSLGYIAPEYGARGELSTYGDVYSYGILVLEMFTGKRPTDEMFTEGLNLNSFSKAVFPEHIGEIVDPFLLQECQGLQSDPVNMSTTRRSHKFDRIQECLASILEIGIVCSSELPQDRMRIGSVVSILYAVKQKLL